MRVVRAQQEHVSPVIELLSECTRNLRSCGIYQWDDVYPDLHSVAEEVANGTLYVALEEGS